MSEWGCDHCGVEVPDGAGRYLVLTGDRVCGGCAEKFGEPDGGDDDE